jgi:hypothetical protein
VSTTPARLDPLSPRRNACLDPMTVDLDGRTQAIGSGSEPGAFETPF